MTTTFRCTCGPTHPHIRPEQCAANRADTKRMMSQGDSVGHALVAHLTDRAGFLASHALLSPGVVQWRARQYRVVREVPGQPGAVAVQGWGGDWVFIFHPGDEGYDRVAAVAV